jgi:hypothetical protein
MKQMLAAMLLVATVLGVSAAAVSLTVTPAVACPNTYPS